MKFFETKRQHGRLAAMGFALAVALVTGGCLKLQADVDVKADATASGKVTIEVASQAATLLGIFSSQELADTLEEGGLEGTEGLAGLANCKPLQREGSLGVECPFESREFQDPGGLWRIERLGDQISFTAVQNAPPTNEDNELFGDFFSSGSYEINVTMPGKIVSLTGTKVKQVNDRSLQIKAGLLDGFEVAVTSEKGRGLSATLALAIAAGAVLVAGAIAAIWWATRRPTKP